jgi:hypothetical protein
MEKVLKKVNVNDLKINERSTQLKDSMILLLDNGYKVISYINQNGLTSWFHFTKDSVYYGYMEKSSTNFYYSSLATVHEGSKKHGTGTRVYDGFYDGVKDLSIKDFEKVLNQSKNECLKYNLKPSNALTFSILNYIEVIK